MSALIFLILILAVVQEIESHSNLVRYNGSNTAALARDTENTMFEREVSPRCLYRSEPCGVDRKCCRGLICRYDGVLKDTCANEKCIPLHKMCTEKDDCCGTSECLPYHGNSSACLPTRKCAAYKSNCNAFILCCKDLFCVESKAHCDFRSDSARITLSLWTCIAVLVSAWTFKFVLV